VVAGQRPRHRHVHARECADDHRQFSAAGTYVLRLTANDGALVGTDDVTVVVNPPANVAPIVNAGQDQTITLPATAALTATVTDDGQVQATPTLAWLQVSGPGIATFTAANALTTTVSFNAAGTYVLRLTANDGALVGADDVTVVVIRRRTSRPPSTLARTRSSRCPRPPRSPRRSPTMARLQARRRSRGRRSAAPAPPRSRPRMR